MFLKLRPSPFEKKVTEVAIADLNDFQIVVPTFQASKSPASSTGGLTQPQRDYSRDGWVIHQETIIGTLQNLEIGAPNTVVSNFQPIKRLAPGVPITFETRSRRSLPYKVRMQTAFAYQFRREPRIYYSLLRQVQPTFVRIYAVSGTRSPQILMAMRQFLIDEKQFVTQNREHLKNVAFYRKRFGLDQS